MWLWLLLLFDLRPRTLYPVFCEDVVAESSSARSLVGLKKLLSNPRSPLPNLSNDSRRLSTSDSRPKARGEMDRSCESRLSSSSSATSCCSGVGEDLVLVILRTTVLPPPVPLLLLLPRAVSPEYSDAGVEWAVGIGGRAGLSRSSFSSSLCFAAADSGLYIASIPRPMFVIWSRVCSVARGMS
ncbi:hypothetical protein DFH27DRAFT_570900 [Peziza echinospora]|nr:hypothetical protein DFH27DRAFT_570900 [Peziza echinospora]